MGKFTLQELKSCCENIYIKGAGVEAVRIFYDLLLENILVKGFASNDTDVEDIDNLYGIPVYKAVEGVIVEELEDKEMNNKHLNLPLMLTMIHSRFHNRPVFFVIHEETREFWTNLIETMRLEEASVISVENEMERIYELGYLDTEKLIVAIATQDMEEEISDNLKCIGLEETKNILYIHNSFSGTFTSEYKGFDWMLGNTYFPESAIPGFYKYSSLEGENDEDVFKIVVLGNSTTDPLFYRQTSWTEYLCQKYRENNKKCIVYNGAMTDYSSGNELLKLIRDVVHLSPDVVISYSGIIDFRDYEPGYPWINLNLKRTTKAWCETNSQKKLVLGIKDNRDAYTRWLQNEKIMQAICQSMGIRFFGVLQPWIGSEISGSNKYLKGWYYNYWREVYPEFKDYLNNADRFIKGIKEDSQKFDWLKDFTNIFSKYAPEELYYDSIHVNELGNQIVAENMLKVLDEIM